MRNMINTDYYNHPGGTVVVKRKDITSSELQELADKRELRYSVIVVAIVFAIIICFGILAESGSTYI